MPEKTITSKDTKAVILKEYEKALTTIKELKSQQFNPTEIKKKEAEGEAITHTEEMEWDLQTVFARMRRTIDDDLRHMQATLEVEKEELEKVKTARDAIKTELETLYGISVEAQTFAALVESQRQMKEAFELETREHQERMEEEKQAHETGIADSKISYEKERKQRESEWEYSFDRECQQRRDLLDDELAAKRKEWADYLEQQNKLLGERRDSVAGQEAEVAELKDQVANFPARLEAAAADALKKAETSQAIKEAAIKRNYEADMQVEKHKATTLSEALEKCEIKVAALETKLESAYEKIQGVATKALDAQGNANTIAEVQRATASASSGKK